ncbi:MAG: DUF3817 domain-containing protein [Actinomycetota bacterium]|nr:DUF3817 domain-containing protein [Actinomycetota bacterium]
MSSVRAGKPTPGAPSPGGDVPRRGLGLPGTPLMRYRVMAYIVGVALIVLVFAGVPLQLGAGQPGLVSVLGPVHGLFYIVYLATGLELAFTERWKLGRITAVVFAGFVPFLAFVVERRVTRAHQIAETSLR